MYHLGSGTGRLHGGYLFAVLEASSVLCQEIIFPLRIGCRHMEDFFFFYSIFMCAYEARAYFLFSLCWEDFSCGFKMDTYLSCYAAGFQHPFSGRYSSSPLTPQPYPRYPSHLLQKSTRLCMSQAGCHFHKVRVKTNPNF